MLKYINTGCKAISLTIIIGIISVMGIISLKNYIDSVINVQVDGRIYGKYVGQEHHKYYSSDVFNLAVHPNNSKYRDYSVVVDYSVFAKYNVGDNVSFKVSLYDVTDVNKYERYINASLCILFLILVFGGLSVTLTPLFVYIIFLTH